MNRISAVRTAVTAVTLLVLGAGTLRAQRLDTTLSVRGQPRLSVSNTSGDIVVRVWSRAQVEVQAEYDRSDFDDRPGIEITESAGRVSVRTLTRRHGGGVNYTINVPHGTGVEVNGVSSDVTVNGVCGDLNLNTISGDVGVDCIEGDAQVQTVSGDVTVANVRTRHLEVGSTSGDVIVRGVHGGVGAHSVSGDITLTQIDGDEVTAETVSGGIEYDGRIADNGRYSFEAHSGDVSLRVSGTFNATVSVSTFNGDFESDFPVTIGPGRQSQRDWEFRQGTGSARVRLQSFNGTINLRRGSGSPREE
ncbi:MAG: DUF4097 family beta strand repeat-containing protein [Gemmatimonadales bacterium]